MSPRTARSTQTAGRSTGRRTASSGGSMDPKTYKAVFDSIVDNVETVIRGKDDVVSLALVAVL